MKKYIFLVIILTTGICRMFAVDFSLSAGGGGILGYTFTRYTLELDNNKGTQKQSMDRFDYGGFLFFDATYAELSVLFQGGSNSWTENMNALPIDNTGTGTEMSLGFSILGKYPFTINEKLTWFPLVGIEYHIALVQKRQYEGGKEYDRTDGVKEEDLDKNYAPYPLSAWNSFWVDIGAGLDYSFTDSLFLRSEILFGFRLKTTYEAGVLEMNKQMFDSENPKMGGLTGSPRMKLALGYRF